MDNFYVLMRMAMDHRREMLRDAELRRRVRLACASQQETLPDVFKRPMGSLGRFLIVLGHRLERFGKTPAALPVAVSARKR